MIGPVRGNRIPRARLMPPDARFKNQPMSGRRGRGFGSGERDSRGSTGLYGEENGHRWSAPFFLDKPGRWRLGGEDYMIVCPNPGTEQKRMANLRSTDRPGFS